MGVPPSREPDWYLGRGPNMLPAPEKTVDYMFDPSNSSEALASTLALMPAIVSTDRDPAASDASQSVRSGERTQTSISTTSEPSQQNPAETIPQPPEGELTPARLGWIIVVLSLVAVVLILYIAYRAGIF